MNQPSDETIKLLLKLIRPYAEEIAKKKEQEQQKSSSAS
jgi:hypothetical protein